MKDQKRKLLAKEISNFCIARIQSSQDKPKTSKSALVGLLAALLSLSIGSRPLGAERSAMW